MTRTVADLVADPRHAGPLEGAGRQGQAEGGERLVVRVGLWLDARGAVARARYRATTCASLIAYAEACCELLEAGQTPATLGPGRLRAAVAGVHPIHHDRAELVARALTLALGGRTQRLGGATALPAAPPRGPGDPT